MKLTNIYSLIVHGSKFSNYIFVIAETNEGICGYGDATLDGMEFEVVAAIKNLSTSLIGKNVEKDNLNVGNKAGSLITSAASSGIDMAMWDLKGKAFGLPVYKLLGGAIRSKVPVYASFNRLITDRSVEGFGKMAETLKAKGNKALKCHPFDGVNWKTPLNQTEYLDLGCARFIAMREAAGCDVDVAVDCHWRLNINTASYVADKIRPYRPFWFETPIPEKNPELLAHVRKTCGIPVAGAEMKTCPEELLPLLKNQCLDVYMPDVRYCGGITGMTKMVHFLETYEKLVSPHNMCTAISCAASLHTCAVMPNLYHMEYHPDESEWIQDLTDYHFDVVEGNFEVPDRPGLGINLNLEVAKAHPYERAIPVRANMLGA